MAVDLPAPEKPVMITRSVRAEAAGSSDASSSSGSLNCRDSTAYSLTVRADARVTGPVCQHGAVSRRRLLAAAAVVLAVIVPLLVAVVPGPGGAPPTAAASTRPAHGASGIPTSISASVSDTPTGQAMPSGFVGVSIEFKAVQEYTGGNPKAVNPVFVHLLQGLAPGQPPLVRIGGNSTDQTWWPMRGTIPPAGVRYSLTPDWLRTTRALGHALGGKMIVGVNLAAGRPALAAAEARALVSGIGRQYISALEIGNEPDIYTQFPWYSGRGGLTYYARPEDYSLGQFITDYSRWASGIPNLPLAGPAFAELTWLSGLGQFISAEPRLSVLTVHRYPLRACVTDPISAGYPTIPALLSDASASGLIAPLAPYVQTAHTAGLPFRLAEMNSAACRGKLGVSNTFASSLWILDTLFNLAGAGADGVNVHTFPGAPYQLFTFTHGKHGWTASVNPEYYGMLLFAQAFPPGAQMLPVTAPAGPVKIWATRSSTGRTRVVLINKSTTTPAVVSVQVPSAGGKASLESLQAPSVDATTGVTLGGRTFGTATRTGRLGAPRTTPITATAGSYEIAVPAASAVMLTQ